MLGLITFIAILIIICKIAESLSIPTFFVFLILKLCNVITWSWVCVCIPLFVLFGLYFLKALLVVISEKIND